MNLANVPDQAADAQRRVEGAIRSTQQAAHSAVDHLADGADRLASRADRMAQRGGEALREHADHLRERARHVADGTIVHIREEPLKAVLIAGALGAVLGALFTLLGRARG